MTAGSDTQRIRRAAADARYQLAWLLAAVTVLLLARTLEIRDFQRVIVPWTGSALPRVCLSSRLGFSCPACGLTRSFIACAHLKPTEAVRFHPAGPLWFAAVVAQIPYRLVALRRIKLDQIPKSHGAANGLIVVLVVALVVGWIVRIM
jgi:hypothetical protein